MTAYPAYAAHTTAFIELCRTASSSVKVGDGERPPGVGWQGTPGQSPFVGYIVVYPIGTNRGESTMAAPNDDVEFEWQTTITAASRAHAETIFDLLADVLIDTALTVPGRACSDHLRLSTDAGGVRREEFNQQPPLWLATPRWAVTSVPE